MTDTANIKAMRLTVSQQLKEWFTQYLGQYVLDQERAELEKIVPNLFGYHLMQIGLLHDQGLFPSTRIGHCFVVQIDNDEIMQANIELKCSADSLPISSNSVDVVVLPHVLEFSENPHKILREIERVLIGRGRLIIIGFNPWSLFGLWRIFLGWRDEPPWCGHFFSFHRIRDWFTLLGFELIRHERICYRPPIKSIKIMKRLAFMEKLGKYCWSIFSGIYIVEIEKTVVPVTPVKDIWLKRRNMIKSSIVEPTT